MSTTEREGARRIAAKEQDGKWSGTETRRGLSVRRGHGRGQGGPRATGAAPNRRVQHATTRYRHLLPSIRACRLSSSSLKPYIRLPRSDGFTHTRRRFCVDRHHDRSVDRSWHRARGTKSKAKPVTPVSGPSPLQIRRVLRVVHVVFLRVIRLSSFQLSFVSSSSFLGLSNPAAYPPTLSRFVLGPPSISFRHSPRRRFLLFPSFSHPLPLPTCTSFFVPPSSRFFPTLCTPPAPSFRPSFSPHARRPTAVVQRAFALVARTCHSDGYQE